MLYKLKRLPDSAFADRVNRSFPIFDAAHVRMALVCIGRIVSIVDELARDPEPKNGWNRFKLRHFPKFLLRLFPVEYDEISSYFGYTPNDILGLLNEYKPIHDSVLKAAKKYGIQHNNCLLCDWKVIDRW